MSLRLKVFFSFSILIAIFFLLPILFGLTTLKKQLSHENLNTLQYLANEIQTLDSGNEFWDLHALQRMTFFASHRDEILQIHILDARQRSVFHYGNAIYDELQPDQLHKIDEGVYVQCMQQMASAQTGAAYKLTVCFDVSEIEQAVQQSRDKYLLIFVLGLFFAILVAWLISSRILGKMTLLTQGIAELRYGNLDFSIKVTGNDEIDRIIRSFNRMSANLQKLYTQQQREKQFYDQIFNTIPDGIVTIDQHGLIQSVNPAVISMFGFTQAEMLGQNVSMLMPDPYRQEHDAYLHRYQQDAIRRVIGIRRRLEGQHKQGHHFPLDLFVSELKSDGKSYFVGVIRDLSEIDKITKELKFAKALNDKVLDTALDAVITLDQSGAIMQANPAAIELFGYPGEELIGQVFSEISHYDHDRARLRVGKDDSSVANPALDFMITTKSGEQVPVELQLTSLELDNKEYINIFIRNIEARLKAESFLIEAKEQALQASRSKSEFLAVMSHEIRTPLNAIMGSMAIIEDLDATPEQRKYLKVAREGGKALLWLINDILDFSKIEAGKLELESQECDLIQIVEEVVSLLWIRAQENKLLLKALFCADAPVRIFADQAKLTQVLINLVSNAIKFTEQGMVSIRVEAGQETDTVAIRVVDTGVGISESDQQKLFTEFTQVDSSIKRRHGGTGLGLAISLKLTELMHGRITVESQPNEGSTFTVTMPVGLENCTTLRSLYPPLAESTAVHIASNDELFNQMMTQQLDALGVTVSAEKSADNYLQVTNKQQQARYLIEHEAGRNSYEDQVLNRPITLANLYRVLTFQKESAVERIKERRAINRDKLKGKRLLLAEDSHANQIIATALLNRAGYEVDVVANGLEAVEAVKKFNYDLVLMDVSMPEMDGIEATREIRKISGAAQQLTILALTANVFKDDIDHCMQAGMNGFIPKPIDKRTLLSRIAQQLIGEQNPADISKPEIDEAIIEVLVDEEVFQRLKRDVGEELLPEMIEIFVNESRERLENFKLAIKDRNFATLRAEAHAIKSSSGAVGLTFLQHMAYEVELACREERFEEAIAAAWTLPEKAIEGLNALEQRLAQL